MRRFHVLFLLAVGLTLDGRVHAEGSAYDIDWYTLAGGGGAATGGAIDLDCTIGQSATATMTGGDLELTGGYWVVAGAGGAPCPPDVDGNGIVNFGDLLAILGAWGPCNACPEDVDGDGVVAFGDILAVLGAWGVCP